MGLKNAVDAGLTTDLDTVPSLEDINAIAAFVHPLFSGKAHSIKLGFDAFSQFGHEEFGAFLRGRSTCEIIDLTTDENLMSIDGAGVEILLMGCVLETHLVDDDIGHHLFPQGSSFWVSLQRLAERDDMRLAVVRALVCETNVKSLCVNAAH